MAIIYISLGALYHTKDYQGTTTDECGVAFGD